MNQNPFRYGTVVDDPFFTGRESEHSEIYRHLLNGQSIVLWAPRRYGKTSLIIRVLNQFKKEGHPVVYLDFFKIVSIDKFILHYSKKIFSNLPYWEKAFEKIKAMVKVARPVLKIDESGIPVLSLDFNKENLVETLDEVIDLPQNLDIGKRWIVVFDEFQEIDQLNGESFEKQLRACIQHHDKVSYVFLGSRQHLMTNIFSRRNRAFYRFAKHMHLDKIHEDTMIKFVHDGFAKTQIQINPAVIQQIIQVTENIPYYVQYLSSEIWESSIQNERNCDPELFVVATEKLLRDQDPYFMSLYQNLTAYQQRILLSVFKDPSGVFSLKYTQRNDLSTPSSTHRAIESLIRQEILQKTGNTYTFSDPFFRLWFASIAEEG